MMENPESQEKIGIESIRTLGDQISKYGSKTEESINGSETNKSERRIIEIKLDEFEVIMLCVDNKYLGEISFETKSFSISLKKDGKNIGKVIYLYKKQEQPAFETEHEPDEITETFEIDSSIGETELLQKIQEIIDAKKNSSSTAQDLTKALS